MALHLARLTALADLHRPRALVIARGLLAGVAVAAAMLWAVLALRQQGFASQRHDLKNLAFILTSQVDNALTEAELAQRVLVDRLRRLAIATPEEFARRMAARDVHEMLRSRVATLPSLTGLALISVRGDVVNLSPGWPRQEIGADDRAFFRALRSYSALGWFIGRPLRTGAGQGWAIPFVRKFRAPDGTLLGYVATGLEFSRLEHVFAQIRQEGDVAFSIYRRDGMLLMHYPSADPQIGHRFGSTAEFGRILAALNGDVITLHSTLDGVRRMVAVRDLARYPLLVVVGTRVAPVLPQWTIQTGILAGGALLLETLLAAGTMLGLRNLKTLERAHVAEAALAVARERARGDRRFNLALDNMRHGLCMFERSGELVVANRSFLTLFNLPPAAAAPGISYFDLTERIVSGGTVSPEAMAQIRARRAQLIESGQPGSFELPLTDGRIVAVQHQPLPDYWLATYEDITERRTSEAKLMHMAQHDALTGLPNRLLFHARLETAVGHARRGHDSAVLMLDLDQFKSINDTLGHPVGDALLQAVAQRLTIQARNTDTVARLGGDEFAILATMIRQAADATVLAQRIIEQLAEPFDIHGHHMTVGVSIGIALTPQDALDCDQLLRCADLALYRAKSDGRGVYRLFHVEMDAHMQARRALELDLRRAVRQQEFELFYQPFVALPSEAVVGFEALLRWRHPERGLLSPGDFIAIAEEIGLIVPIGAWALLQACRDAVTWPNGLRVGVNLSPVQFRTADLVTTVTHALQLSGLPAERLELEITESLMMEDTQATLASLHALHSLGIRIAMDDFGTGYSSPGYLRRFPFDRVKIDKSFVRELGRQADSSAIVRAVASMSSELGLATTAEGVESREQLAAVAAAGCREVQGYLFSPAVPGSEVVALLEKLKAGREPVHAGEDIAA